MSLLLAFAAAAAGPAAPPPEITLTFREAQALSPRDLATRVLGEAGHLYSEAQASDSGPLGVPGLGTVNLARTPRSAGLPGLCIADTLSISFGGTGREADPPRRPAGTHAGSYYFIVGDTNDRRGWTEASERRQEILCSRAGPVLDSRSGWPRFFGENQSNMAKAHMAARMLQAAMVGARSNRTVPIACADDPAEPATHPCANPRAVLAALPMNRLRWVLVDACENKRSRLCATLTFVLSGGREESREVEVFIESDAARVEPAPRSVRILSVSIHHQTMVV